ncbi:MAG: nuclear transport factor 2 family protein, partial [Chlorobium sp.]|nr:nuclear transport factor 2 family protein [Chlorobium sp.]
MKNLTIIFTLLYFYQPISSSQATNDPSNIYSEKKLVEKAIHNCIDWAKNKDINLLYSVIANDTSFIEIHPNNRVVKGFEEFKKAEDFWMDPNFKAIRYEIKDLDINFSKSSNVAWFYCVLDDINEW